LSPAKEAAEKVGKADPSRTKSPLLMTKLKSLTAPFDYAQGRLWCHAPILNQSPKNEFFSSL
jgi:hypothetical protein